VAGGVANPATGEIFLGSLETGVTYNGRQARVTGRQSLDGALVLASRSEVDRGEWERFRGSAFTVRPVGSVAYKLALVAAGLADATWTLVPKHEWDVAAGVALVLAAGGSVQTRDGSPLRFNQPIPKLTGLVAQAPALATAVKRELGLP
jgi:myo-inositol-1(or 4)-monophosphatase